jgi:hypothetical protein
MYDTSMKKKSSRSFSFNANTLRNLLIAYAILASTFALFLIASFYPAYVNQQRLFAETDFKHFMRDAALAAYDEPQRLNGGTKLAVPEANIAFPIIPGEGGSLLYQYEIALESTPEDSVPETLHFASKSAINALVSDNEVFGCQRLATVSFTAYDGYNEPPFEYAGSVKLADNREMFMYQNKSAKCTRVWSDFTSDRVIQQLKKAEILPTS